MDNRNRHSPQALTYTRDQEAGKLLRSETSTVNVFAYGSNMSIQRMQDRVANAVVVATGYVCRRRFMFHKRGVDGSAKANAALSSNDADAVWGVVYRIPSSGQPTLDRFESLGVGYDRELLDVIVEDHVLKAWMYVARREAIDDGLKPFAWYHDFVLQGAQQHRLPNSYVTRLRQFESIRDADDKRHALNQSLLG